MKRRPVEWIALGALCAGLMIVESGCSAMNYEGQNTSGVGAPVSLQEAKSETFAFQDEVIALIPEADRQGSIMRTDPATLQDTCDGVNVWRWPGSAGIHVDSSFDSEKFLQQLEAEWQQKPGWSTNREDDQNGIELRMTRDDGMWISVFPADDPSTIFIGSNSACFQLGEPADPNKEY